MSTASRPILDRTPPVAHWLAEKMVRLIMPPERAGGSRVLSCGSNYRIFDVDGDTVRLKEPSDHMVFAFRVSLEVRKLLLERGVPCSLLIWPADLLPADPDRSDDVRQRLELQVDEIRRNYKLPGSFVELLREYGVHNPPMKRSTLLDWAHNHPSRIKGDEVWFASESAFKRAATRLVHTLLKDPARFGILRREDDHGREHLALSQCEGEACETIALGSRRDEEALIAPKCQVICAALTHELWQPLGFNQFAGIFEGDERACVNQGMSLSHLAGSHSMEMLIVNVQSVGAQQVQLVDMKTHKPRTHEAT